MSSLGIYVFLVVNFFIMNKSINFIKRIKYLADLNFFSIEKRKTKDIQEKHHLELESSFNNHKFRNSVNYFHYFMIRMEGSARM